MPGVQRRQQRRRRNQQGNDRYGRSKSAAQCQRARAQGIGLGYYNVFQYIRPGTQVNPCSARTTVPQRG